MIYELEIEPRHDEAALFRKQRIAAAKRVQDTTLISALSNRGSDKPVTEPFGPRAPGDLIAKVRAHALDGIVPAAELRGAYAAEEYLIDKLGINADEIHKVSFSRRGRKQFEAVWLAAAEEITDADIVDAELAHDATRFRRGTAATLLSLGGTMAIGCEVFLTGSRMLANICMGGGLLVTAAVAGTAIAGGVAAHHRAGLDHRPSVLRAIKAKYRQQGNRYWL